MKLKEHYARFKMITIHHLWKSIFKCLLKPLWLILYLISISISYFTGGEK